MLSPQILFICEMCVKKLELAALKILLLLLLLLLEEESSNHRFKVTFTYTQNRLALLAESFILNFNMSAHCHKFIYECIVCVISVI